MKKSIAALEEFHLYSYIAVADKQDPYHYQTSPSILHFCAILSAFYMLYPHLPDRQDSITRSIQPI